MTGAKGSLGALGLVLALFACERRPEPVRRLAVLGFSTVGGERTDCVRDPTWVLHALEGAGAIEAIRPPHVPQLRQGQRHQDENRWAQVIGADAVLRGDIRKDGTGVHIRLYRDRPDGVRVREVSAEGADEREAIGRVAPLLGELLGVRLPAFEPGATSPRAFCALGEAHAWLDLENPEKAALRLEEAVRSEPQAWTAWLELGHAWLDLGRVDDAHRAHRRLLGAAPGLPEVEQSSLQLLSARLLQDRDGIERAARAVLGQRPWHLRALLALGETASDRIDLDEARRALERLHRVRPDHRRGALALAEVALAEGHAADAARILDEVPGVLASVEPDVIDARAVAAAANGDLVRADALAVQAADVGLESSRLVRAWLALIRGDLDAALAEVQEIQRSPDREIARALLWAATGQCAGALEQARAYAALSGKLPASDTRIAGRTLLARITGVCEGRAAALAVLSVDAQAVPTGRASLRAVTLRGILAAQLGRFDEVDRALSLLRASEREHGVRARPLLALIEGERALQTGAIARALAESEVAGALVSEAQASLRARALERAGQHEACARAATQLVPDLQWPGEIVGLEGLPSRSLTGVRCLEALGEQRQALALRRRLPAMLAGQGR